MRQSLCRPAALSLVLVLLAGCITAIQPRVGNQDAGRPTGIPPDGSLMPRPSPMVGGTADAGSDLDQVCRTRPMPSGWIAVRYEEGGEKCPKSTDPENPYTLSIIQRHTQMPVGATMIVCADQSVPRDWLRERSREATAECPGARVPEGTPTGFVIRRVR